MNGMLDDNVMTAIDPKDDQYIPRVAYDLSFFVWVGLLLFNIITGLLVDSFGAVRDEGNARALVFANQCFMCGFTRDAYNDLPDFDGEPFEYHRDTEHKLWDYVFFYVYLTRKPQDAYTGVESYVAQLLEHQDLAWLPRRTSAAIEASSLQGEALKEKQSKEALGGSSPEALADMAADIKDLKRALAALTRRAEMEDSVAAM